MAESSNGNGNGNGCYLVSGMERIPIKQSLFLAIKKLLVEQKDQTGSLAIHVKNGGATVLECKFLFDARE